MANMTERELVLADNEQALIQDTTKGHVNVYVGPHKASLSETDRPVSYNASNGTFEQCSLAESKKRFTVANESSYVVLQNPTDDTNSDRPSTGNNSSKKLMIGRKINIPGPVQFPLWPGQSAQVVQGHQLRTNQYLIARVYNDKAAEENWEKTILKTEGSKDTDPQTDPQNPKQKNKSEDSNKSIAQVLERPKSLAIGTLFIIPGDRVSYYVPPTGIEVLPDNDGSYVREAVTLERLEYCVLLDENGDKRFVTGPKVVFPKPTEVFVEENGSNVFRALELNHLMGLHIKVIADYKEGETEFKTGQELFITGKDENTTTVYYPRAEHAIIRYGNQQIYYAVTIPKGEARYVLNRTSGEITLVKGPTMFLPDPRKEVIVKRILSSALTQLLYPGNNEAVNYNASLETQMKNKYGQDAPDYMDAMEEGLIGSSMQKGVSFSAAMTADMGQEQMRYMPSPRVAGKKAQAAFVGAGVSRRSTYTEPRTLTLETKYQGAVAINIWNGYAVMIVDKSGNRRVELGPKTVLLEYDEVPEILELSTGKPKTTDNLLRTVYLRTKANKISDIVDVETKDYVHVSVKLSYRVNFEGEDHQMWFECENYVKFLCDHMRSLLKNRIHRLGIREFHENATDLIREIALGIAEEGKTRPGKLFEENNMRIYDVEVLEVKIGDATIARLLVDEQHRTVQQEIDLQNKRRELELTQEREQINTKILEARETSRAKEHEFQVLDLERGFSIKKKQADQESTIKKSEVEFQKSLQVLFDEIQKAEVTRTEAKAVVEHSIEEKRVKLALEQVEAEAKALKQKGEAISPQLIAALQQFSDAHVMANLSEAVSPIAMIQRTGIMDILAQLFEGSGIGQGVVSGATQAALLRKAQTTRNGSEEVISPKK